MPTACSVLKSFFHASLAYTPLPDGSYMTDGSIALEIEFTATLSMYSLSIAILLLITGH